MRRTRFNTFAYLIIISVITGVSSCTKEDSDTPVPDNTAGYSKGIFIINEGMFQEGTGTIDYVSRIGDGMQEKVYQHVNDGNPLGNIVQSMNALQNAYIAVNNANKVEVVDLKTFKRVHTIEDITSPRYIEFGDNGKAYISCWDNTIKVVSTGDFESFGQIPAGEGPEKMLRVGSTIWVLNQGGFSVDSTITIISTETDQVLHTLAIYPKPTGIQLDKSGKVWVMCSGIGWNGYPQDNDSEGHLLCIDPENYAVIRDFQFPSSSMHPEKLVINANKDQLFYNYPDGVYRMDISDNELPENAFISRSPMFYGLGLDAETNRVYTSDPVDFTQKGWVYRYDAGNGSLIDSLQAGIAPGEFFFTRLSVGGK